MTQPLRIPTTTAALLLIALGAGGCSNPTVAEAPTALPVVAAAQASRANFANQIVLTAEFIPYQEVDVLAKVSGYVRDIKVDMGDNVRTGELLASLEIPEMQDQMKAADSALAVAQNHVVSARGEVQRTQAAGQIATLSYTRIRDVLAKEPGLVPQQDVDVAHSRDLEAQAQLASAQAALQAALAAQQQALDEQDRLQTMYRYTNITAPFDGVITRRYANVGSLIQAGISSSTQAMPLVRLAQNDLLRLILPVPVSAASGVHIGEAVDVDVVTLGKSFPGKVRRFANEVQTATRTMDTEVDVPNPDRTLMPGIYAEVHLHLQDHAGALSVPLDAIQGFGTSTARVLRIGPDQRLQTVPVQVGLQTPTRVEITSGLNPGDLMVVGRVTGLSDGERVQPRLAAYDAPTPAPAAH